MKIRDWLNKNSALVTIGAVLLLIGALVAIIFQMKGTGAPQPIDMYYYDLLSDKPNAMERLFVGKSSDFPPIEAPSGKTMPNGEPAGVRAWVYACGDCADASARFIGFLELFTREAKELALNPPKPDETGQGPEMNMDEMMIRERGHLIATVEAPDTWVEYNGPQGTQIIQNIQTRCGASERPRPCYPE